MTATSEIERLRAVGVTSAVTAGEILEGNGPISSASVELFDPARLGEPSPPLPKPGIYFGMPDDEYHALPALSNGGIKYLAASPMLFWARTPWLNPKKAQQVAERAEEGEKEHHVFGKAYHCRLMEGASVFATRYVIGLNPADYPDCLVHTDEIKAAIRKFTCEQPVKPCSARKDDLKAQLERLREANPQGIVAGLALDLDALKVEDLKSRIREYKETVPVKPVAKVFDADLDDMRAAVKADWIDQLLELDPNAQIFDRLQAAHVAAHEGKTFLTSDQFAELEVAAMMVERDPEVQHAFKGGYAEVVLIWVCPETGVLMKARVDYLKIKAMVDLKTVGNQRERSIENAIRWDIATFKYNIQPGVYTEGAHEVRKIVREQGKEAINVAEGFPHPADEVVTWALKWASHLGADDWFWVFQQKGDAPITRGVKYRLGGVVSMVTNDIIRDQKRKFITFSKTFGTDPWLDVKPIYDLDDEDIPQSATEI